MSIINLGGFLDRKKGDARYSLKFMETLIRTQGLSIIATKPRLAGGSRQAATASVLQQSYRTEHIAAMGGFRLRLVYTNSFTSGVGESATNNDIVVKASLAKFGSNATDQTPARIPVTWNGARTVTIPGGAVILSDPIAFEVVAGEKFFVQTAVSAAETLFWPVSGGIMGGTNFYGVGNGEGRVNGDSVDDGTAYITNTATANVFYPTAILGNATSTIAPTVAAIGDSICSGTGDAGFGPNMGGFIVRALTGQMLPAYNQANATIPIPHVWVPQGGEKASQFANRANSKIRLNITDYASNVFCNYGTNDLSDSLAIIKANILAIAGFATRRGQKFWQCTIVPRTTSTNGWQTVAAQTMSGGNPATVGSIEYNRRELNLWLRDAGASGFIAQAGGAAVAGVFDICKYVEVNSSNALTPNGGFWKEPVGGIATSGTVAASGSNTTNLVSAAGGMTSNAFQGRVLLITSGALAGVTRCIAWNNATTFGFNDSLGGTPATGESYIVYAGLQQDGIHPASTGHILMGQEIAERKGELV